MSLNTLISEHVASVFFNTEHFAEVVLRYVGGDSGNVQQVTGIVTWQPTVVSDSRGKGYVRRGELLIGSDVVMATTDGVKVGDVRCEVESIDLAQDGARVVHLLQYEPDAKGVRKAGDI